MKHAIFNLLNINYLKLYYMKINSSFSFNFFQVENTNFLDFVSKYEI